MIHTNIDITDAGFNTTSPFTYDSDGLLGSTKVQLNSFLSIKIQTYENIKLPLFIYKLAVDGSVDFHDATGTYVCSWSPTIVATPSYTNYFLYNKNHILMGHLTCHSDTAAIFAAVLEGLRVDLLLPRSSFTLSSGCCVPSIEGTSKALKIGDSITVADCTLTTGAQIKSTYEDATIRLDLVGLFSPPERHSGISTLRVNDNDYWIGDKHLYIRHSVTSNIRLVQEGSILNMKGVLDA